MEIQLTQGKVALIDDADWPLVSGMRWRAMRRIRKYGEACYARSLLGGRTVLLHQLIAGKGSDHKNGNGLDNRRCNLRPATTSQQGANRIAMPSRSGFKGVSFSIERRKHWVSRIAVHGKRIVIGNYDTPEEAAHAYDDAARNHFGDFACVNFPREGERSARREAAA